MFEYKFLNSNEMVLNKLVNDFSGFSKLDDLAKYTCDELLDLIHQVNLCTSNERFGKIWMWIFPTRRKIEICFLKYFKCHPIGGILCL